MGGVRVEAAFVYVCAALAAPRGAGNGWRGVRCRV